ncbi:MAG: ATP-binding protein [Opitutaceae bacterium]|nr:ATP-binding protein [Opitutaceae bacterium]
MPRCIQFHLAALCFALIARLGAQELAGGVLTSCAAVRALTPRQAAARMPTKVQGVVTLVPADAGGNFTLDDGTGVWVRIEGPEVLTSLPALKPGDLLEVTGVTHEGHFAPTIVAHAVRLIGTAPLPRPRRVTLLDTESGAHDSQRVTAAGVVQAAEIVPRLNRIEVRVRVSTPTGGVAFTLFTTEDFRVDGLVDAEVSISGVFLAYFNSRRQFIGARVLTNSPGDLRILRPRAAEAFDAPEVALSDVTGFSARQSDLHRRRVRGTVTLSKPGHYFYLQEKPHAVRVNTRQTDVLQPGDIVEAAGFFQLEHHRAEMHEAVFRRVGRGPPPEPEEIVRQQALVQEPRATSAPSQDYDDYLVSLRGRLLSVDAKQGEPLRLNLECDGVLVPAEFTSPPKADFITALRADSELLVSGICAITFSESRPVVNWPVPIALRLLLRGPEDVQVLRAASWWTPERLWTALGLVAVVLFGALAWVASLRRQVAQRGAQLAEEMRARRDAAVEFETTLRERTRLAADLHDTTEQSLTGLAFQLEATMALNERAPERSQQHMALARQLLDRSREDLRRSIWNLRAVSLEQQTLAEALHEIAADRGAGLPVAISVTCEGESRPLPDIIAGNLLLLAQEAITNALKHARPQRIELCLSFSPGSVRLQVRDDGRGFDPGSASGPKHGHFGLQGMRERMKRIGGRLEIVSAPGRGTTITTTVDA